MTSDASANRLVFRAVCDEPIGSGLSSIFASYWPAYKRWLQRGEMVKGIDSRARVGEHMPELLPVFDELLDCFGGGDKVAQFLSLYNPPRVVRGCSQIVLEDEQAPVLLRSYDHHPDKIDALIVKSTWTSRSVLCMSDCIWGALDGINDDGLAISLAFGGRDSIGDGFAAPLIVRYMLETCSSVDEAKSVLERIPVYMPYTFLIVDAHGSFVTAYTGPDIPARFVSRRASTNHQHQDEWPAYQRHTHSVERQRVLESMLAVGSSVNDALDAFLAPPLWRTDYAHASGTLYVAQYRPIERSLSLHWPDQHKVFQMADFHECELSIELQGIEEPKEPADRAGPKL